MHEHNLPSVVVRPKRRGYSRLADIPQELIDSLNRGEIETATLAEQLAVDLVRLLQSLSGWKGDRAALLERLPRQEMAEHGILKRMQLAADALGRGGAFDNREALGQLLCHRSDLLRGLACYVIGMHPALTFSQKLEWIRPLAADHHFGVREWAWLALRPEVVAAPQHALEQLKSWVLDANPRVRRFAVEITRPRGVWAKHLPLLVEQPLHGLPILEPCSNDASRYVQNSVANCLNDAAKSHPAWVSAICADWLATHAGEKACRYITRRAQRNIGS